MGIRWQLDYYAYTASSTDRFSRYAILISSVWNYRFNVCQTKDPATRNDFVNDIVNDARADAIFATLKAIVDDEKSTISSTISLRVAWPLDARIPS